MSEEQSIEESKTPEVPGVRACNHCGRAAIITRAMLSIYTGETVRMFECSCGQRSWSEE
jgi:hypothetical protein